MTLRRRTVLSLPLVAGLGHAVRAAEPAWDAVVAAGNRQGRINLLHNVPPPMGDIWIGEFRKAFPKIEVEATRLGSSELMQRFNTENAAGASQTDAVMTLWDDTLLKWSDDGLIRTWTPPEAAAFPAQYKARDQLYIFQVIRSCVVSNKIRIHDADAPKDWTEFFNPKWKGRIGMDPPWRSVAVQEMLAYFAQTGQKDIAQRLKANGVRFFNGSAGVVQALIRGDIWVASVIDPPVISALGDGAPIRAVYPALGIPAIGSVAFVPAKAPNAEAGMVFMNWMLSESGQKKMLDIVGSPVTRPGVGSPKLVPGLEGQKVILSPELLTPATQKAIIDEWRSVFGLQ
jgi:iron(III) transport system substrate-binding protein